MSKTYFIYLLALINIAFAACAHEKQSPKINITGISMFDEFGSAMSAPDPDDWTHDVDWSSDETKLMLYDGMTEFTDAPPSDSNKVTVYPVYPNPSKGPANMGIKVSKACKLKLALVDENLLKVFSNEMDISSPGDMNFSFHPGAVKKGQLYRLYYVILNSNNQVYYKGHGDIRYE